MVDFLSKAAPLRVYSALWQSDQLGGSSPRLKSGGVSTPVRSDSWEARGQVLSFRQARAGGRFGHGIERIGASHRQHSTERSPHVFRPGFDVVLASDGFSKCTRSRVMCYSHLSLAFASATVCHCIFEGLSGPPRLSGMMWSTTYPGRPCG